MPRKLVLTAETMHDAEAKQILLKHWPEVSAKHWGPSIEGGHWVRAQPKRAKSAAPAPMLRAVGSERFRVQPDGMWVFLAPQQKPMWADVMAVEYCSTGINFDGKRSRYMPSLSSAIVECGLRWLLESIGNAGDGKPRWKACGTFVEAPIEDMIFPIRFLRVLYVLPNRMYNNWKQSHTPAGHEFFMASSSFANRRSPNVREFVSAMSPMAHFYPRGEGQITEPVATSSTEST